MALRCQGAEQRTCSDMSAYQAYRGDIVCIKLGLTRVKKSWKGYAYGYQLNATQVHKTIGLRLYMLQTIIFSLSRIGAKSAFSRFPISCSASQKPVKLSTVIVIKKLKIDK